MCLFSYLRLF
uniref:Uncharacterized protein n=1 Tax=Anguilla anguilla TaxID=7936 RepID=A0A0E9QGW2_ANGAN